MESEIFEGGCLCGAVRFRANVPPVRGVLCHCSMCRKHSGAPALAFVHFPVASFRWLGREPARYRSSKFAERGFCPDCGSTLSMHESVLEDRVQVTLGSLDAPGRARLDDQVWVSSRIEWFEQIVDLPAFDENSSAVPSDAGKDGS